MKRRLKTVWHICLVAFLIVLLLAFCVPWQRVWSRVKVPVLIQCFRHGPAATRRYAAIFLAYSNGDKKMIVSVLLPSLKDKDEGVREMTAIALGDIHQEPKQVVPALFACIDAETNPASLVPNYALGAIGQFRTNAKPWSPILYEMIVSNGFNTWPRDGIGALNKINPEMAKPLIEKERVITATV